MNAQSFHIMAESTLSSAMNSRSQLDASAPIWTPKTVQQASPYYPVGMQAHHPHQHAHHQHAHHQHAHPQQQQQWQPVAPGSPLLGSPVHQHHQSISPGSPLLGSSPGTGVFLPSSSPSSRYVPFLLSRRSLSLHPFALRSEKTRRLSKDATK